MRTLAACALAALNLGLKRDERRPVTRGLAASERQRRFGLLRHRGVSLVAFYTYALAALLLGCSPSTRTGYESPTGSSYSLSIVSGDHQSGAAVVQPVTVSIGTSTVTATTPAPGTQALPLPLVVEVRDAHGALVDGVLVRFSDPTPNNGVVGLGTETSGQSVTFSDGRTFPATKGRAATSAQPYRIGQDFPVNATVDPSAGTSNTVVFRVSGT